jgi:hypothetical protein
MKKGQPGKAALLLYALTYKRLKPALQLSSHEKGEVSK